MTGISSLRYYIVDEEDNGIRLDQFLTKTLNIKREKIKELFGQNPDSFLFIVRDIKKLITIEIVNNINLRCGEIQNLAFLEIQNLKDSGILHNKKIKLSQKVFKDECFLVKLQSKLITENKSDISDADNHSKYNFFEWIIFEDQHIIIINKMAGILSQSIENTQETSISDLTRNYLIGKNEYDVIVGEKEREFIVHRLDKDTSGLMILAKNNESHQLLIEMFKSKKIEKKYLGLVYSKPNPVCGIIREHVGRDKSNRMKMHVCVPKTLKYYPDAKEAVTHYFVREYFHHTNISLVKFILETGRTHQIRVHLDFIGHPIVGDRLYGTSKNHNFSKKYLIERQMLHSYKLSFLHPVTSESLNFEIDLPNDMIVLIEELKTRN